MTEILEKNQIEISQEKGIQEKLISELLDLKNKYKDFPKNKNEIVHSNTSEVLHKAQNGWFVLLNGVLTEVLCVANQEDINLSDEIIQEIKKYNKKVCTLEFSSRDTTKEDIESAEKIIDKVIDELEDSI